MTATDLATPTNNELEVHEAFDQIETNDLVLPLVKLAQGLTKEVQEGTCSAGEYINSVTGHVYGEAFEFIIAAYFKGRFYSVKGGPSYATNAAIMPDFWDHPDAGKPFVDSDDAEERFKAAVNEKQREWGHGPPISTTHNYVGYVLGQEEDELGLVPVRLSLMRTHVPAARALNTLLRLSRDPRSRVFNIGRESKKHREGTSYVTTVAQGRAASSEEQAAAVALSQDYISARVQLEGDGEEPAAPVKPEPTDGMEVG